MRRVSGWIRLPSLALCSALICAFKTIRIGNKVDPRELHPLKIVGRYESQIVRNLFEGLIRLDPLSGEPRPGQAEAWTRSPDGLTYTFYLRRGLKWSDGNPLKAEDYVLGLQTLVNPLTASEYAYQAYAVKHASAINHGQIKDLGALGIRARGERIVEFNLDHPVSHFYYLLALECFSPLPSHILKKAPTSDWTAPGKMISNGPYVLREWAINRHIRLSKNPHYWEASELEIDEVYFIPTELADTEDRLFESGELELTAFVSSTKIFKLAQEKQRAEERYHPLNLNPTYGLYYLALNLENPILKDPRVRKALQLSMDRGIIAERVIGGGQRPAPALIPPGSALYPGQKLLALRPEPKDLALARKLLAEAGYPEGRGFPRLKLLYNTDETFKKLMTVVQQIWKKELKIELELENQEWKVYLSNRLGKRYDIVRAGWNGEFLHPQTFLARFSSDSTLNEVGFKDQTFDELLKKAESESDPTRARLLTEEAERRFVGSDAIIPLYFDTKARLVNAGLSIKVGGRSGIDWRLGPLDQKLLRYWQWGRKQGRSP